MSEFEGQTVVVTGVAGALGQAVGSTFHQARAKVIGIDILDTDSASIR